MGPVHIVLLDHDTERRRSLAELLRAGGCRVFETGDAPTAAGALGEAGVHGFGAGEAGALVVTLELPALDFDALRAAIAPAAELAPVSLEAVERGHIARTLAHTAGNRRQAAIILGISRSTLLHKIRKYGLDGGTRRQG
ncbi:MAG TPA: helix-turn-helix domain-containing protein [Gemmatimonadales bacterium]|nr:helix-turn-helix domain-containing protein [Gemmatimonadales bacterium]